MGAIYIEVGITTWTIRTPKKWQRNAARVGPVTTRSREGSDDESGAAIEWSGRLRGGTVFLHELVKPQVAPMLSSSRHLIFHGAVVLLFGILLGAPYAKAINRCAPAHIVNSWRIAHQSLPIAAILMFAVAAILPTFSTGHVVAWLIAGGLIGSSYAFCVSMPMAAVTGHRGLSQGGKGLQKLVLFGNVVGAWLSVLACVVLLFAAGVTLWQTP
ncbi:hypothetical protein QTI66_08780 [Variovorax sp. J22R133]|uniref:hypothetical protein n=1 Tax=Variovorax brevis TaxID=3053503 RepID=UPI0025750113|nr:hypothetical protein [Variovorax sp. J22R133]MDM0112243.1 hypothetical protein [Variovorax sp. J22R133]